MYQNVFQTAWVTNDLARAADVFREQHGVNNIGIYRDFALSVFDQPDLVIDVALFYVGDLQFEVIEPVSGPDDLYRRYLPAEQGFLLKHHHFGNVVDNREKYDALLADFRSRGVPIDVDGSFGDSGRFFYADTRDSVDHYQEFVLLDAATEEFLQSIPRN